MRPVEPIHQEVPRVTHNPDAYEVHDVVPGKYVFEMGPSAESFYVHSARSGNVDLLREPLVVPREGSVPPIELVVRDDGATLSGTVHGAKATGAVVVLVPEKSSIQTPRMAMVSEEATKFSIGGVPPGDYLIYVFDSEAQIEYANPSALEGYASKGVRVTLSPRGHSDVDVELTHIGE